MEDNSGRIIHENDTDELVVYEDSDMTTSAGVLLLRMMQIQVIKNT